MQKLFFQDDSFMQKITGTRANQIIQSRPANGKDAVSSNPLVTEKKNFELYKLPLITLEKL